MLQIELSEQTEHKVEALLNLYPNKNVFFDNLIDFQIQELRRGVLNMKKDLSDFELKYKMSSSVFYQKFDLGEIVDSQDFMIWAGVYEMYLRDVEKLKQIQQW